jgi:type VI secretion system protein ImpA
VNRFAAFAAPLSEDLPCGPNPDGDPEFENFIASAEGQLPASFFSFSKSNLDAAGQAEQITALLAKFRDIRLLTLAGKFAILSGSLEDFSAAISTIAALLRDHWALVHPQAVDGDFTLRAAYVSSLDDMPTVVLPLQHAPLVNDRRVGAVSYRSHLIATGAVQRRQEEAAVDRNAVQEALVRSDLEALKGTFDAVTQLGVALKQIRERFTEEVGFEQAPGFERLAPLVGDIAALLKAVLTERDASFALAAADATATETGAPPDAAGEQTRAPAALPFPRSMPDVGEALKAIERYYAANEPSSPAVLLVRQAEQLIGKSFVETMQSLAPTLIDKAAIRIGGDSPFALSMAQLKALVAQTPGSPAPAGNGEAKPQEYAVGTRSEAAALMEIVERYYRKQEPSSPIPLLLERARLFVDRDFSALLKDILSKPPAG